MTNYRDTGEAKIAAPGSDWSGSGEAGEEEVRGEGGRESWDDEGERGKASCAL